MNKSLVKLDRSERSYEDVRNNQKILKMFPFNSDTKKMTVAVEIEHEKVVRIYTKGASENIVDGCLTVIGPDGLFDLSPLSAKEKLKSTVLKQMASSGLRTIAIAYKDLQYSDYRRIMNDIEYEQDIEGEEEESKN